MCLNVWREIKPTNRVVTGYKVFWPQGNELRTLNTFVTVPRGVWVSAHNLKPKYSGAHKEGWYGFETQDGTEDWGSDIVLKVKFRRIHTRGNCFGSKAFVLSCHYARLRFNCAAGM